MQNKRQINVKRGPNSAASHLLNLTPISPLKLTVKLFMVLLKLFIIYGIIDG